MLKELLPKVLIRKPNSPEGPEPKGLSPNLLRNYSSTDIHQELSLRDTSLRGIKIFIILVEIVLLVVIITNSIFNQSLQKLSDQVLGLAHDVEAQSFLEHEVRPYIEKPLLIKQLTNKKFIFSEKVAFLLNSLSSDVTLGNASFTTESAHLSLKIKSPLVLSLLISNYFKNPKITAVIINSASLNPEDKSFNVALEITYVK